MPTTTYRADDFLAAAEKLGIEVVAGTDRCHVLAELGAVTMPGDSLVLDFRDPEAAAQTIVEYARDRPVQAVVGVDDRTQVVAALARARLGLSADDPRGARATEDKLRMRIALKEHGVAQARFMIVRADRDPERASAAVARRIGFPCVLKPRRLSASRGVIRADDPASFRAAFVRVGRILADPEVKARGGRATKTILVESFVPGFEVAVEGILRGGALSVLAIFDKPDPLDGPFFEETIYVTPSRLPEDTKAAIGETVEAAALALGLREGPVHAELRISSGGCPYMIELAARSIGGLCSRTLRFGVGISLEELILRHAFELGGEAIDRDRAKGASGVMMLPIPRTGILRGIDGIERARAVPGIEDLVITARTGREIVALPEGNQYLGFLFARTDRPESVEAALREAYRALRIEVAAKIPTVG